MVRGRPKRNNTLQLNVTGEKIMKEQLELPAMNELETIESAIDKARIELENTKREIEEKKISLNNMSSREHDKKEMEIVEKQVNRNNEGEAIKEKIARQKAYDNEKVTGRFMNRRAPGQPVKLTYIKYEDDPVKWYDFEDGKVYTIQRGFADQINEYYYTPQFIQKPGQMDPNRPSSIIHAVDDSNKKYAFTPVNF